MSVTTDILRTYRAPGRVLRDRLSGGKREERALAILMGACVLMFVAQWPRLSRQAHLDDTIELDALMASALFGWVFVAPLLFYGLAALSHLVARAFGGTGDWHEARMALFWALLAATPLWLLTGLAIGFIGVGAVSNLLGLAALVAFLLFWISGLRAAEWPR